MFFCIFEYFLNYQIYHFLLFIFWYINFIVKCTGNTNFKKGEQKNYNTNSKTSPHNSLSNDINKTRNVIQNKKKKLIDEMVDTSKIHGHGNEKGKKNNGKHKKNRLFGKTSPTNTNDLTFDKEKINAKKRKKMKGILILKTANEFEGNSTLTPVHKICHKSKSLDLVVTREKNNENSETNKSSKKKRKNNKGGNKEEYSDKDDKVHDAVDNDGNPKYARLIDFNDEELLNSDKVEEKSRNKSKSTTSKKATQEKSMNKFCDSDTKKIRNVLKTASFEKNKSFG